MPPAPRGAAQGPLRHRTHGFGTVEHARLGSKDGRPRGGSGGCASSQAPGGGDSVSTGRERDTAVRPSIHPRPCLVTQPPPTTGAEHGGVELLESGEGDATCRHAWAVSDRGQWHREPQCKGAWKPSTGASMTGSAWRTARVPTPTSRDGGGGSPAARWGPREELPWGRCPVLPARGARPAPTLHMHPQPGPPSTGRHPWGPGS